MLQFAYISAFKFDHALVFWGDAIGMEAMAKTVRSGQPFENPSFRIVLSIENSSVGLLRIGDQFIWRLDVETLEAFHLKILSLARSGDPCHQYLECGTPEEIPVVVSKDEYPPDWRPQ